MVTDSRILGPQFDIVEDDSEETLVGSSLHQGAIVALTEGIDDCQGAIVALTEGIDDCAARRGLPWFVGNQLTLVFPRQGERPTRAACTGHLRSSDPHPRPAHLVTRRGRWPYPR